VGRLSSAGCRVQGAVQSGDLQRELVSLSSELSNPCCSNGPVLRFRGDFWGGGRQSGASDPCTARHTTACTVHYIMHSTALHDNLGAVHATALRSAHHRVGVWEIKHA
jgi:hypothetical protein